MNLHHKAGFAGTAAFDLSFYRPWAGRGTLHQPPHRRHVYGPTGGVRRRGGAFRPTRAPVYPGVAGCGARCGLCPAKPSAHHPGRRGGGDATPGQRMPLCAAMPHGDTGVPEARSGTFAAGGRAREIRSLSSRG